MKRALIVAILISFFKLLGHSESLNVGGDWGGLNNSPDDSISSADNEAQDLLNVYIANGGHAIRKRFPKVRVGEVSSSTCNVRGGYSFFSSASTTRRNVFVCGSTIAWISAGTFNAFVTTDTAGGNYDFADMAGSLWRANSRNDQIFKYDGTSVTYYPSIPRGNQIEFLPDRFVVSGTTSSKNSIYFSSSADFTNFTIGPLETDSFTESVGIQSDKITFIKAACGGILIGTENAIYIWRGTNQYDGVIEKLSDNLGSYHPATVQERNGVVYFQNTDARVYVYDCNTFNDISKKINFLNLGILPASHPSFSDHVGFLDKTGRYWISVHDSLDSVSDGFSSYIFIYDPRYDAWTKWGVNTYAMGTNWSEISGDVVMFGGASTATVTQTVLDWRHSDEILSPLNDYDGSAINAYWKSKDFSFPDPYVEKNYSSYSVISDFDSNSPNLSVSYIIDGSTTTTTNTHTLGGSQTRRYKFVSANFPSGTVGNTISFQFGNSTSLSNFEVYSFQIDAVKKPWRVRQ